MSTNPTLTLRQAYTAMFLFIQERPDHGDENDLTRILTCMPLQAPWLKDYTPPGQEMSADPAYWSDWQRCAALVTGGVAENRSLTLTNEQARDAMVQMLDEYVGRGESADRPVSSLATELRAARYDESDAIWRSWLECCARAIADEDGQLVRWSWH